MGFFDNVKDLAEKVGDTVDKGIKSGADSYKKMNEKSRIKKDINRLNSEITNAYLAIGKRMYEEHPEYKEYSELYETITERFKEIEVLNGQLSALEDKLSCPKCGELIAKDSNFCDKCGAKIEHPEPAAEVVPEPEPVVAEVVRICKNCGAELVGDAHFCDKCGTKVED